MNPSQTIVIEDDDANASPASYNEELEKQKRENKELKERAKELICQTNLSKKENEKLLKTLESFRSESDRIKYDLQAAVSKNFKTMISK